MFDLVIVNTKYYITVTLGWHDSGKGVEKTKCTSKIFFIGHFNLTLNRLTISEMHTYNTKCDI